MITQNGLNLFRIMLTNTCLKPSEFTNIENGTDFLTSLEVTRTTWNNINDYYNGSAGTVESGTFRAFSRTFMPEARNRTLQLNLTSYDYSGNGVTVNNWNARSSMYGAQNYSNYLAEEEVVVTIPVGGELGKPTRLTQFNQSGVSFFNARCYTDGTFSYGLEYWQPLAVYGTPPNDTEYLTLTLPKCFYTDNGMYLDSVFGVNYCILHSNLGYSKDTESVDNYDLSSPVYNKKLNPVDMEVRCLEGKLEFTISFKNFESESISVNEFGLYIASDNYDYGQPIDADNKVSLNGYKLGKGSTHYYDSQVTEYDEVYISRGIRPNLIARKVLPQTVTIPPDGIATFKYTIDLSEMKAQENITYSEE